jgi:hypothetical protein
LPERRLLAQLLPFAAANGSGDKVAIGARTNIPTGNSTGKVEPIIHYAVGMGLVTSIKISGGWQLGLTALGHVILDEDPFLSERQTLWLMHLMLCRRLTSSSSTGGIADPWFALFAAGGFRLGMQFRQQDFADFLVERHGDAGYLKSLAGIVVRSYLEDSCLGDIGVLQEITVNDEKILERQPAPVDKSFFPVYAAYLYLIWDELFSNENQVSLDGFASHSRCFVVLGWDEAMIACWLDWMADTGLLQIDRYTGAPILLRLKSTMQVISTIYSEII